MAALFTEAKRRIAAALKGPRKDAPPSVRAYLRQHGDAIVTDVWVCRQPIVKAINVALDFITLGLWSKAKKSLNYDDMFHLYMIVGMRMPDGRVHKALLERNQVVRIEDVDDSLLRPDKCRQAAAPAVSFGEFVRRGVDSEPSGSFWVYDAVKHNCQDFVMSLLTANSVSTPALASFVKQDASTLLPDYAVKIARGITDFAASADILISGEGFY